MGLILPIFSRPNVSYSSLYKSQRHFFILPVSQYVFSFFLFFNDMALGETCHRQGQALIRFIVLGA